MGAVGHHHAPGAAGEQGTGRLLACLTRANHHDRPVLQGGENPLREIDSDRSDGNAAALDAGFGPDLLGDVEGALKGLVQPAAGVAVLQRQFVSPLELARISVSPSTIESSPHATRNRCSTLCGSPVCKLRPREARFGGGRPAGIP